MAARTLKMNFQEKKLYHQIHPIKLITDISAAISSSVLFWFHYFWPGILANLLPPMLISFIIISSFNLDKYKNSKVGIYLKKNMTGIMEAVRFSGNIIMLVGAWFHNFLVIFLSILIIVLAWLRGLILPTKS